MHRHLKTREALRHQQGPGEFTGVGDIGAGDQDIEFLLRQDLGRGGNIGHRQRDKIVRHILKSRTHRCRRFVGHERDDLEDAAVKTEQMPAHGGNFADGARAQNADTHGGFIGAARQRRDVVREAVNLKILADKIAPALGQRAQGHVFAVHRRDDITVHEPRQHLAAEFELVDDHHRPMNLGHRRFDVGKRPPARAFAGEEHRYRQQHLDHGAQQGRGNIDDIECPLDALRRREQAQREIGAHLAGHVMFDRQDPVAAFRHRLIAFGQCQMANARIDHGHDRVARRAAAQRCNALDPPF